MDYRAFLGKGKGGGGGGDPVVLPYFGGTRVDAVDRRLRVEATIEPGWWQFRIDGRTAVPIALAEPGDLAGCPAVRGHWAEGWLFGGGGALDRIALPPAEEPAPLARCVARRWPSGDVLLDAIDFEDDAELEARAALEQRRPLGEVRGVVPSLRAAFGFALAAAVARELGVTVAPHEVADRVLELAELGRPGVVVLLQRHAERAPARGPAHRGGDGAAATRPRDRRGDPRERIDAALDAAGARMVGCRRLDARSVEVRFDVDGTRIICVADSYDLQILDAGVCLDGSDRELTIDSLPSVIREAIATHQLNITRHG
ncbi:MAG: hypothetical protein H6708_16080 [Kofleriaceae bacterium]|nr:hypothetical protein [Kofleriaceae bacterium]